MKDRRRITIFDTTPRDGERLGVDVIEAGFAFSSPGDFEGVQAVVLATSPTHTLDDVFEEVAA